MSKHGAGGDRTTPILGQILPPPPPGKFRAPHETPEPDSLEPMVSVPPPPPLPPDPNLIHRVRNSLPAMMRRSVAPIRNTFAPFAPYIRRTWEPIRATIAPWVPRWKPWSPQRVLAVTAAFAALFGLAVVLAPKQMRQFYNRVVSVVQTAPPDRAPAVTPGGDVVTRADLDMVRSGKSPVSGAIFALPPSFTSEDGSYDVVVHFHGNTDLVAESFEIAKVNAAILLVNIGIGSGPYEDRFSNPDVLEEMLARVKSTLEKRGLKNPKPRRLGLTAWSAGYGAVVRIIENPSFFERVDAVILLDGIHASYLHGAELDPLRLAPYERLARKAMVGDKLFVISHSDIRPGEYPGSRETTDALLKLVGVLRKEGGTVPLIPSFSASHGVPKNKILSLKPTTEAHVGDLHVKGYTGESPEHHMAHLIQMASIGLPYLADRWKGGSSPPSADGPPVVTPATAQ